MVKISKNFTSIAPYYDLLMKRINYREWLFYVESFIKAHRKTTRSILDIACGTGNGLMNLRENYEIYLAFDRSIEMIRVFKKKIDGYASHSPIIFVADARKIPFLDNSVDAAFSIFDSLNNLLRPKDLKKAFKEVYRILSHGGVFVFDLNTVHVLKEKWGTKTRIEEDEDMVSIWRTRYHAGISELHITLFVRKENGRFIRIDEIHRERGYNRDEVLSMLKDAGFRITEAYEHLTYAPPKKDSFRINYVAVK